MVCLTRVPERNPINAFSIVYTVYKLYNQNTAVRGHPPDNEALLKVIAGLAELAPLGTDGAARCIADAELAVAEPAELTDEVALNPEGCDHVVCYGIRGEGHHCGVVRD